MLVVAASNCTEAPYLSLSAVSSLCIQNLKAIVSVPLVQAEGPNVSNWNFLK